MAFILLQLLVVGVIAAAADDVQNITWLVPPRGVVPCVVAEAGRAPREPPPPITPEEPPKDGWRGMPYKHNDLSLQQLSANNSAEVSLERNGTQGEYQCVLKHDAGTVLGYSVPWKFAYMEKQFTRHPENSTASAGQPHVISCYIKSAPAATVTWLRDEETLPRLDRYIFLSSQLLITELRKEDAGSYKCTATNPYLNETRTSYSGRLTVVDPEDRPPALLHVDDQRQINTTRYSRVQLLCPVTGWPRPQLTWELTSPGSSRTATLEYTDEVLLLSRIELDQEGVYKCYVDNYPHLSKVYNVTIIEPVNITLPPISKEAVMALTIRFNCTATGKPEPVITWYKDGKPLVLGQRLNLRGAPNQKESPYLNLVVGAVTSDDAGVYQCFARSGQSVASSWAALRVVGQSAPAPAGFRCWPLNDRTVKLYWERPPGRTIMAYTVTTNMPNYSGQPHQHTEEIVNVKEPFVDYSFQVRVFYIQNMISDFTANVTCQGQGVPIRMLRQKEDYVEVSWKEFAKNNPTVRQWKLQYRRENSSDVRNVTLPAEVHSYSLPVPPNESLQVRVLGSKTDAWVHQNLTSVPWTSTSSEGDIGEVTAVPGQFFVTQVQSREFTFRWNCYECEGYTYVVCVRKPDGTKRCLDSPNNTATIDGLEPESEYEVEVYAKSPSGALGPVSLPLFVTTQNDGPQLFKDLRWRFVNSSAALVSWRAPPAAYSVLYSGQLDRPVEAWDVVNTRGNTALITGIDRTRNTYFLVMTGDYPKVYSPIKTIPAQISEVTNLQYAYTDKGVKVKWEGKGARLVHYSQNLTSNVETWPEVRVAGNSLEITNLDPTLKTYVMVAVPGPNSRSQVLTIPPRPTNNPLYLGLSVVGALIVIAILVTAAFCIWRRRKRAGSPLRIRRRNVSSNEDEEEEGAEMRALGGRRLANGGGSKDAGEPLLNGHVHITENPQSKAPNGKMKKDPVAFDLSRYDDPDNTLETVLDADTSSSHDMLDTSRQPDRSSTNSFSKLPDDNMNSEITSEFPRDNSKIQPTLQPNG